MYFMSNLLFMEIYGIMLNTIKCKEETPMDHKMQGLKRFILKKGTGYFNSSPHVQVQSQPPKPLEGTLYSNGVVNHMVLHLMLIV